MESFRVEFKLMNEHLIQPSAIAAAAPSSDGNKALTLEKILLTEDAPSKSSDADSGDDSEEREGRKYLDLYWTDASERNGVVYLYGRVKVPDGGNGGSKGGTVYQSCCVAVPNNERNLFVLPRIKPGELPFVALVNFSEVSESLTYIPPTDSSRGRGRRHEGRGRR